MMYELEIEWRTAKDGFLAGVDFKLWLANQVLALRAVKPNAQPTSPQVVSQNGIYSDNPNDDEGDK